MAIEGARAVVVDGAGRDARASRGNVLVGEAAGEGAQAGRADGALRRAGLAQRSAASSGAGSGTVGVAGPLAYRPGALAEVPQALERGKRLDVRV